MDQSHFISQSCFNSSYMMNVVLLDDDVLPWSINFVKPAVLRAVEHDSEINFKDGNDELKTHMLNKTAEIIIKLIGYNGNCIYNGNVLGSVCGMSVEYNGNQ